MKLKQPHWSLKRILSTAVLMVAAFLWWAFAQEAADPVSRGAMFTCATACLVAAFWPHYGLALVLGGIAALSFDTTGLDQVNPWNMTFLVFSASGMAHLLRRHRLLAWIGMSFPFWAMSDAVPFLVYVALGLVFMGLVLTGVRPLISRSRGPGVASGTHPAAGPLIEVPERVFEFRRGRKLLAALFMLCGLACLTGIVLWLFGFKEEGAVLALSTGILALTFGFSLWFTTRMHFRIDAGGIHSRVLFREKSIRWHEIENLSLRYVYFPGFGLKYIYYRILSARVELLFPHTMTGAGELCELIEKASGLKWPEA